MISQPFKCNKSKPKSSRCDNRSGRSDSSRVEAPRTNLKSSQFPDLLKNEDRAQRTPSFWKDDPVKASFKQTEHSPGTPHTKLTLFFEAGTRRTGERRDSHRNRRRKRRTSLQELWEASSRQNHRQVNRNRSCDQKNSQEAPPRQGDLKGTLTH